MNSTLRAILIWAGKALLQAAEEKVVEAVEKRAAADASATPATDKPLCE